MSGSRSLLTAGFALIFLLVLSLPSPSSAISSKPDHIVYGAGTAGCYIANKLVLSGYKVQLITNGQNWFGTPFTQLPFTNKVVLDVATDFARPVRLQKSFETLRNSLGVPRTSHVVFPDLQGGAADTNGGICNPVDDRDFDQDLVQYGVVGWSSSRINALTRPLFTFQYENGTLVGNGPIRLTRFAPESGLSLLHSLVTNVSGASYNPDFASGSLSGSGRFWRPVEVIGTGPNRHFERQSSWQKFVVPILDHPNFELIDYATVTTVSKFAACRTIGSDTKCVNCVNYIRNGVSERTCVKNGGSLIDATGYARSPIILAHSGIGDCPELATKGIDCFYHSPNIGKRLSEQFWVGISFINTFPSPDWEPNAGSIVSTNLALNTTATSPNIEIALTSMTIPFPGAPFGSVQSYTALIVLTKPRSTGYIKLQEPDWTAPVNISYGIFNDPVDRQPLREAIRLVLTAAQAMQASTPTFSRLAPSVTTLPNNPTDAQLNTYLDDNTNGLYHTVSTVPMGSREKGGVLDSKLRFRGVSNLFVCHQGSRPAPYSSHNTHYGAYTIATVCAEEVIAQSNPRPHWCRGIHNQWTTRC